MSKENIVYVDKETKEIKADRTEFSKTFYVTDTERQLVSSKSPIHVQNKKNEWVDITCEIKNGKVVFIINTTEGRQAISDSFSIRREALQYKVSYTTTIARGWATLQAIDYEFKLEVRSLGQLHGTD